MTTRIKNIPEASGYKFDNTHIRLGSKIHVGDFYLATKLFQKSHYAIKFAYLVADYIANEINSKKEIFNTKITLVGYGLYSELLLSNVERFLKKHPLLNSLKISFNHIPIDDTGEIDLSKKPSYEKIEKNIIIIVPISSTLSTAIKIENTLKKHFSKKNIKLNYKLIPHINIILIGNGNINEVINDSGEVIDSLTKHFWDKINVHNKIVKNKNFDSGEEREHKYFVYLPSKWHNIYDCEKCFTEEIDLKNEEALFDTDQSSVLPSLIFDFPIINEKSFFSFNRHKGRNEDIVNMLSRDIVYHGHFKGGQKHFLFYINTETFFQKNEADIKKWCKQINNDMHTEYAQNKKEFKHFKIIIITPVKIANSQFVNLINTELFNDTATIIHFTPDEDYILNHNKFFKDVIQNADKIYYVDALMATSKTFLDINYFVKLLLQENENNAKQGIIPPKGIDHLFTLINRMDVDTQMNVQRKLNRTKPIYAFLDLHVPVINNPSKYCFLCVEEKKFKDIYEQCLLDSLRLVITQRIEKLKLISPQKRELPSKDRDSERHKKQLMILHLLTENIPNNFKIFFKGNNTSIEDFDSLLILLREKTKNITFDPESDFKIAVFKSLSLPPLVHHKDIKQTIFKWLLFELDRVIIIFQNINPEDIENICSYKNEDELARSFSYLKFLIRRAAYLKSNYLLSETFFKTINNLMYCYSEKIEKIEVFIGNDSEVGIFKKQKEQKIIFFSRLIEFKIYIVSCIKELIHRDEAKCIKLEKILNNIENIKEYKNNQEFNSLIEMLRLENVGVIQEFVSAFEDFEKESHQKGSEETRVIIKTEIESEFQSDLDNNISRIEKIIEMKKDHYKVQAIKMFESTSSVDNKSLYPLILLNHFLFSMQSELNEKSSYENKIKYLLFIFCRILSIRPENGGAFMLYRFQKTNSLPKTEETHIITIIGNINISDSIKDELENTFAMEMLYGSKFNPPKGYSEDFNKHTWTSRSLFYNESDENWYLSGDTEPKSFYETRIGKDKKIGVFHYIKIPEVIYITQEDGKQIKKYNTEGQAVMVFYEQLKRERTGKIPVKEVRYALVARDWIAEYLKRHYDNDIFKNIIQSTHIESVIKSLQHGILDAKNDLLKIAKDNLPDKNYKSIDNFPIKDAFHLQYDIAYAKLIYYPLIQSVIKGNSLLDTLAKFKPHIKDKYLIGNLNDFKNEIKNIILFIFSRNNEHSYVKAEIQIDNELESFLFYRTDIKFIIKDIIVELVRNAEKARNNIFINSFWKKNPPINSSFYEITINLTKKDENCFEILFKNSCLPIKPNIMESILRKGYVKKHHGLHIILELLKILGDCEPEYNIWSEDIEGNKYYFEGKFTFNEQKIKNL